MLKNLIAALLGLALVAACAPSAASISTAIAQTQAAMPTNTATSTVLPTFTQPPSATATVQPTSTPTVASATPQPTSTPQPTATETATATPSVILQMALGSDDIEAIFPGAFPNLSQESFELLDPDMLQNVTRSYKGDAGSIGFSVVKWNSDDRAARFLEFLKGTYEQFLIPLAGKNRFPDEAFAYKNAKGIIGVEFRSRDYWVSVDYFPPAGGAKADYARGVADLAALLAARVAGVTDLSTPVPTATVTPNIAKTATAEAFAILTESRGDGIYLVGVDIAPGVWRNDGTGDKCYWKRSNRTGGIISNHYGLAGGTMYVAASDFQIEVDGCGTWTYISAP